MDHVHVSTQIALQSLVDALPYRIPYGRFLVLEDTEPGPFDGELVPSSLHCVSISEGAPTITVCWGFSTALFLRVPLTLQSLCAIHPCEFFFFPLCVGGEKRGVRQNHDQTLNHHGTNAQNCGYPTPLDLGPFVMAS